VCVGRCVAIIRHAAVYLVITAMMLLTAAALLLVPSWRADPNLATMRTTVLAGTVFWGLIPASHWVMHTPGDALTQAIVGLIIMFLLYGAGFFVFAARIPERFSPGTFDLFFASHQWWHLATFAAAASWTHSVLGLYQDVVLKAECVDGVLTMLSPPTAS
jgi:adiponectin receptor